MRRQLPLLVLAAAIATALPTAATAQPDGNTRTQIEALEQELAELREMAVQAPTAAQGVQELTTRLTALEEAVEALRRREVSTPLAVEKIDAIGLAARSLRRDLELLRTQVAGIEQPEVAAAGGGVSHDRGFAWVTDDGRYRLALDGWVQGRYSVEVPSDLDTVDRAGFLLRRGRVGASGHVGSERFSFRLLADFTQPGRPLRDYYADVRVLPSLTLRAGQDKVRLSRSYITSSKFLDFAERPQAVRALRYDRDVGVWAHGDLWDGELRYVAGVSNGGGPNAVNDNVDILTLARIEASVLGEPFDYGYGDLADTEAPAVMVGAGVAHDLVRLPETIAGIGVGQRDVDADGVLDNVRVLSGSVDATFRFRGLEVAAEGLWRHERWGTILDHTDNADLSAAVAPSSSGTRNYLALSGQASYFAVPELLLVGARVGHSRLPLLGVGGWLQPRPIAERAVEVSGVVQLFREGARALGLTYTLLDFNAVEGADPEGDLSHTWIVEGQLVF